MTLILLFGTIIILFLVLLEWMVIFEVIWDKLASRYSPAWLMYLFEFGAPLSIGAIAYLITRNLIIGFIFTSPLWLPYGMLAVYMGAEEVEDRTKLGLRYVEPATIFVLILLVVAYVAFSPLREGDTLQMVANLSGFVWGLLAGGTTGGVVVWGAIVGLRNETRPIASATLGGAMGWLVVCIPLALAFDWSFQQVFPPGYLAGNPQGLYVTGFLIAWILSVVIIGLYALMNVGVSPEPQTVEQ